MWWMLSYIGANWSLILVTALVVFALAAIAWFAKNWRVAVAAVLVLAAGFAYQQIDHNAYARAQAEQHEREIAAKQAEIKTLEERIALVNKANEMHAAAAIEDAARIEELQKAANETPRNDKPALDRAAARRVRNIEWEQSAAPAAKDRTASGPGRHSKVLPFWKWR